MYTLVEEIFEVDSLNYSLYTALEESDYVESFDPSWGPHFQRDLLNRMFHSDKPCGYVFNYLQMYIALVEYIQSSKVRTISVHPQKPSFPDKSLVNIKWVDIWNDPCYIHPLYENLNELGEPCNDIKIELKKLNGQNSTVILKSLTYQRIIKWADTAGERIEFKNVLVQKLLDLVDKETWTPQEFLDYLVDRGIYQIKFSSWTRGKGGEQMIMKNFPSVAKPSGILATELPQMILNTNFGTSAASAASAASASGVAPVAGGSRKIKKHSKINNVRKSKRSVKKLSKKTSKKTSKRSKHFKKGGRRTKRKINKKVKINKKIKINKK